MLVVIFQLGAEVMAAIDHEVGAFAQLQKRLDQVGKDCAGLFVAGIIGQLLQVALDLDDQLGQLEIMAAKSPTGVPAGIGPSSILPSRSKSHGRSSRKGVSSFTRKSG